MELEKRFSEIRLDSKLVQRPSPSKLEAMKVLRSDSSTALLICPPIKSKLEYFENLTTKEE
jgi:hypothetical protein